MADLSSQLRPIRKVGLSKNRGCGFAVRRGSIRQSTHACALKGIRATKMRRDLFSWRLWTRPW